VIGSQVQTLIEGNRHVLVISFTGNEARCISNLYTSTDDLSNAI